MVTWQREGERGRAKVKEKGKLKVWMPPLQSVEEPLELYPCIAEIFSMMGSVSGGHLVSVLASTRMSMSKKRQH